MKRSRISTTRKGYRVPRATTEFIYARIGIPAPFLKHAHACLYTYYESERRRGD